jgi:hypothetical protein
MFKSTLAALCVAAAAPVHADVTRLLTENGFVEASATDLRAWKERADQRFTVTSDDRGCVLVGLGAAGASRGLEHAEGAFRYDGVNNGEWGGELAVTHAKGRRRVLVEDNIHTFIPTEDDLFVIAGLAHLTLSRGAIYRVRSPASDPKVERVTLLPDAPRVAFRDARRPDIFRAIIVGYSSLMIFSSFGDTDLIEVPMVNVLWPSRYPGSAALLGDELLLGLQGGIGVVQFNPFGGTDSAPRYFALASQPGAESDAAGAWPSGEKELCAGPD